MQNRPAGVVVAASASAALGAVFLVFAAISAASGHGAFSLQIGVLLAAFGLLLIIAGVGLWQLRIWARGPVAAFALMAGFGFAEYLKDSPWMGLLVLLCLAAVAGAVLPSTTRALQQRRVSSADRPPRRAWPQRWSARFGRNG